VASRASWAPAARPCPAPAPESRSGAPRPYDGTMTSMEGPGPKLVPGSRPGPPMRPRPAGAGGAPSRPARPPAGTRDDQPARLVSRVVRLGGGVDPLELAAEDGFVWCAPAGALVGTGQVARVPVGTGPGRIDRAAETVAALLEAAEVADPDATGLGPAAVGALPFHPGTPGELVVPSLLVRTDPTGQAWAVLTEPGPFEAPPAGAVLARLRAAAGAGRPWPRSRRLDDHGQGLEVWRAGVLAALEAIGTGRLDKVVLSREAAVEAEAPYPRAELLARLRRRPGGATYLYASGGFVGASPELLVRRRGRVATSRPMAGTVPRGDSAAAEADGLARLTGSPKEAVEHRLVVDAVADGLAKVADRVQVGRPEVVRLATVAHLATEITAELTGPLPTALELAGLLHPTPAVGGAPRDAALAAIAALEPFDRGCYAGPVGWVDRAGDGEWAIALRCATLDGPRARLLAGAGIVPGSDPDTEWAETEYKLRAMLEVLLAS
jgi:menaquinone-specific isochorismate synthase